MTTFNKTGTGRMFLAKTFFVAGMLWFTTSYSNALTSVEELRDVNPEHWATGDIDNMIQKKVIAGYPDQTFKGDKAASRYEMAVVLNALASSIGRDLARLDAEKSDKKEVQILSNLQQQLQNELSSLGVEVKQLEGKVVFAEKKNEEQDGRLKLLEKTQFHGDMVFGMLADMADNGTGATDDGIQDAVSTLGRLRLSVDVPVVEDKEGSTIGAGTVHTRLIGAFGRFSPLGSHDGNLGADYPFNLYSRITADVSAFNEGLGTGSVGALNGLNGNTNMLRPNIYIESAMYKQHFKHGIPLFTNLGLGDKGDDWKTSGDLYAGLVRWWDIFDVSPYRGNEMTQFQNNAFINIPGIAVNVAQPMVGYVWHQGLGQNLSLDLAAAIGGADVGDFYDAMNVTYEAKLNYKSILGTEKPGSFYLGGYNVFDSGSRQFNAIVAGIPNRSGGVYPELGDESTANAFYTGWNQEWTGGIGTTLGYLLNNNSSQVIGLTTLQPGPATVAAGARQTFSGVLSIPMSLFGSRDKDVIGLGYAFADIHEGGIVGNEFNDAFEHVVEGYYKWQLNDSIALIPSIQFILNRLGLGANDLDTIISLRMGYTF